MNDALTALLVADKIQNIDLTLQTRRVLAVSTWMIPAHTAKALEHNIVEGIHPKIWNDIGWIFWTLGKDEFEEATAAAHPELVALNQFAVDRDYQYLLLTADEAELPPECGLPVFNW